MKMTRKITAILLVFAFLLALTACSTMGNSGGNGDNSVWNSAFSENGNPTDSGNNGNPNGGAAAADGIVLKNKDAVALGTPSSTLDPQSVYSQLNYTPQMFYGDYRLPGGEEAVEQYRNEMDYFEYDTGYSSQLTKIPYRIQAGPNTFNHMVQKIEGYDWMRISFQTEEKSLHDLTCAYTIEGNVLTVTPLEKWTIDEENNKITYSFSDFSLKYEFAFNGIDLTLSCDGKSVTLRTGLAVSEDTAYFHVDNYLSPASESLDGIDEISFRYEEADGSSRLYFENQFDEDEDEDEDNAIGILTKNGLFTFTIPWDSGSKTYQYVYFYCYNDGIILTDGTNVYYYNDSYRDRNKNDLNEYLTEEDAGKLDDLNDSQLEAIVEKKEDLMEDLAEAFEEAGLRVRINEKTGELAVDSSVLFGGDSDVLTDEGKAFLNKFMDAYTDVVYDEEYKGFVAKTIIEGHSAPVAGDTYESALPLSEQRANNVKAYCLSNESGMDAKYKKYILTLASSMEAVGYSNSKPIYDADGNVDMGASRRVSFRFIINLDQ